MKRLFLLAAAAAFIVATPAFAEDTITIGMTNSQTGPLNVNSLGQQHGYEFWRDEVNAAGGIKVGGKTYKVKFVSYDDQSVGGRVQQLYTRLIVQDKANFLFSPYSSGLTATAAVISEQYSKIMIDCGGAEEKTFELGNKYLFHGDHVGRPLPLRRRRGAEGEGPERQDRDGLFRRSVLEGGARRRRASRPRRPGFRS